MGIKNWKSVNSLKSKTSLMIRFSINLIVMAFSTMGFITIPYIIISGHFDHFQLIDGFVIFFALILFAAMFFGMLYEFKIVIQRLKQKDYNYPGNSQKTKK